MSAYLSLMTPMTDAECLLSTLAELGFNASKVEVHDTPTQLQGYRGDRRQQTANIVIRRQHVGSSSNDIGFLATATGYQAIVSAFDQGRYGAPWLSRLGARYQDHWRAKQEQLAEQERQQIEEDRRRLVEAQRQAIHERAKRLGYRVQENHEGETLRLVLIKRSY